MQAIEVLHFSDPGCPWAYSARPAHARLRWRFANQLAWRLAVIGLSESAEAYERRGFTPQRAVDGQRVFRERFGMPFALLAKPRMAGTGRACRAIVAARERAPELAEDALRALQLLQFTTARPLDDEAALREALDAVAGLDAELAISRLDHPDVEAAYQADRALARSAQGGPTEAQGRHSTSDGPVRFTAPPSSSATPTAAPSRPVASSPSRPTTWPSRISTRRSSAGRRRRTRSPPCARSPRA